MRSPSAVASRSASASMSQMCTRAPSAAKAFAMARPMPDAPAVINTRCTMSLQSASTSFVGEQENLACRLDRRQEDRGWPRWCDLLLHADRLAHTQVTFHRHSGQLPARHESKVRLCGPAVFPVEYPAVRA